MSSKRYYIGLGCTFHDSAIAILDDKGEILIAEATERSTQNKRAFGIVCDQNQRAVELIEKYCSDGDDFIISYSWSKRYLRTLILQSSLGILWFKRRLLEYLLRGIPNKILSGRLLTDLEYLQLSSVNQAGLSFNRVLRSILPNCEIKNVYYPHHLTHAAYGCFTCPFDEGVCVVMDGFGEKGSYSIYHYSDNTIRLMFAQRNLASMGFFYSFLTRLCGYDPLKGEEGKVMGLASYGRLDEAAHSLFRSFVKVNGYRYRFSLPANLHDSLQRLGSISKSNPGTFEERANLAYTGQTIFSNIMEEILGKVYELNLSDNLIYTGGCALNSSFNGQIQSKTKFKRLYIPPAPADDGNALGAALISFYKDNSCTASLHKNHSPYLGSPMSELTLSKLVKFGGIEKVSYLPDTIFEITASLLAEGKVVAWIQGRSEFGPRALGNRSILADPRSPGIRDRINSEIKFREKFRPLAPAILHEYGQEYFENYAESPFMERTFVFKENRLAKVPAVVHVDKTGRVQSVNKELNPKFYSLIHSFYTQTGIPILLNTSLNIMGRPIINSIEDGLGIFFTTSIDALVIEDYLIEK